MRTRTTDLGCVTMRAVGRTAWPAEVRARALELYPEHGAAGTCDMLRTEGHVVPKPTVIAWAQRAGVRSDAAATTRAAVETKTALWQERRIDLVHEMGGVAERALDRVRDELAPGGNASDARNFATTMAILVDKAQLLSGEVTQRHGHVDPRTAIDDARERGLRLVAGG